METLVNGGKKTITAATTAEQLTETSYPCKQVWIQPITGDTTGETANTKPIHVGTTSGITNDFPGLMPGQDAFIQVDNANKIYIKSEVNGEGVKWLAIQ